MKKILLSCIILFFSSISSGFGATQPFTDITEGDPIFTAVEKLYTAGVISDNGDHLFRPNGLISRDFFTSLTVGVGCKKCTTPTPADMIRYQSSPYIDLLQSNPYYYCIAYAADEQITQGYPLDSRGVARCEGQSTEYTSSPFCGENNITRIEAAAILLRRANLWNDTLNASNFEKKQTITDVNTYWYGYAQKGIEANILSLKSNNTIGQDEKITRGEFALMAAKILNYNQCSPSTTKNTQESRIGIIGTDGQETLITQFDVNDRFLLIPITTSGSWIYEWKTTNRSTGEVRYFSGNTLPSEKLGEGSWDIDLFIKNKNNTIVSNPFISLRIGNTDQYNGNIKIQDTKGSEVIGSVIKKGDNNTLIATHTGADLTFSWTFLDQSTGKKREKSGKEVGVDFLESGDWMVTLITRETKTGNIVDTDVRNIQVIQYRGIQTDNTSRAIGITNILLADKISTYAGGDIGFRSINDGKSSYRYMWDFGDGRIMSGTGSSSYLFTNPGTYTVTLTILDSLTGNSSQSRLVIRITGDRDTDSDGIFDANDACPQVRGSSENLGCPLGVGSNFGNIIRSQLSNTRGTTLSNDDPDGDGISNQYDLCPYLTGKGEFSGCPGPSIVANIGANACLAKKAEEEGIIMGSVVCSSCPCDRSLEYQKMVRSCDVLFPTILSPNAKEVYNRGPLFLVP